MIELKTSKAKKTWNKFSWSADQGKRWEYFLDQYPNPTIMGPNKAEMKIGENAPAWGEIRGELGFGNAKNAFIDKTKNIKVDGQWFCLDELERKDLRTSGTRAAAMEFLVAIAALIPIEDFEDFKKYVSGDDEKLAKVLKKNLADRTGVTEDQIDSILNNVMDDHAYAKHFIKMSKNIHKVANMQNPEDYIMMSSIEWHNIKKHGAALFNNILKGSPINGDKWNPADFVIVKKGSEFNAGLRDLKAAKDIAALNIIMDRMCASKIMLPISIKKTSKSIIGSRGISGEILEITSKHGLVSIKEMMDAKKGEISHAGRSIPISINYSKTPRGSGVQKKVLGWIEHSGIAHVELTAAIAIGTVEGSSSWWIAAGDTISLDFKRKKYIPKLREIIISMTSDAVWLKFDEAFIVCRNKGQANIQLSAENPRLNASIYSYKELKGLESRGGLNDAQKKFLTESLLEKFKK